MHVIDIFKFMDLLVNCKWHRPCVSTFHFLSISNLGYNLARHSSQATRLPSNKTLFEVYKYLTITSDIWLSWVFHPATTRTGQTQYNRTQRNRTRCPTWPCAASQSIAKLLQLQPLRLCAQCVIAPLQPSSMRHLRLEAWAGFCSGGAVTLKYCHRINTSQFAELQYEKESGNNFESTTKKNQFKRISSENTAAF